MNRAQDLRAGLLSLLSLATPLLIPSASFASRPMIEFGPAGVQLGVEAGYGQCPCTRFTVQVQLVTGQWETRSFLISTDALLAFQRREQPRFDLTASDLFRIGSFEALLKGSRIGLRFDGLTFGYDLDRGTTGFFQTGLDFIIELVQREALRLQLRTGADFESFTANLDTDIQRTLMTESLDLHWQAGRWSGNVSATVGIPASGPESPEAVAVDAHSTTQVRLLTLADLELSLGARIGFSHDAFRTLWGVAATDLSGTLILNVDWIGTARRTLQTPRSPWRQGR